MRNEYHDGCLRVYSPGIDAAVSLLTSVVLRLLAWYISRGIVKKTRQVPTEALKIKSFNWSVEDLKWWKILWKIDGEKPKRVHDFVGVFGGKRSQHIGLA